MELATYRKCFRDSQREEGRERSQNPFLSYSAFPRRFQTKQEIIVAHDTLVTRRCQVLRQEAAREKSSHSDGQKTVRYIVDL